MKNFGYKCSVLRGTDLMISSTKCNWSRLKRGALTQIGSHKDIFQINDFTKVLYTKPFSVKNKNCISIDANIKPYVLIGDSIGMMFKQFEMSDEFLVTERGEGYNVGDLIFSDLNTEQNILLSVESTLNGAIDRFKIINRGLFNNQVKEEVKFQSERGFGFKLLINTQEKPEKNKTDRECHNVVYNETETLIYFIHSLPSHVKAGDIILNKWTCKLSRPFITDKEGDALNVDYKFYTELTPNYSFPLLLPNQPRQEEFLNAFFYNLDSKLHSLQEQIDKLKHE